MENQAKSETETKIIKGILKSKPLLRGAIMVYILILLQAFSGMPAISSYFQTIFDEADGSIDPIYSVMILGVVALLTTIFTSQLVERVGRRLLILVSSSLMTLCLVSLGTYFYLKSEGSNVSSISWLPIASLVIATISFNLQASIPWVLLIDICSSDVIGVVSTIGSVLLFLCAFISTLMYPYLNEALGGYGTFHLFAGFTTSTVIYAFLYVPEFKGKTNEEVLEILRK